MKECQQSSPLGNLLMLNTHKERRPKTAEDRLGLGIKRKKGILSLTKQAGFPNAMPKYQ